PPLPPPPRNVVSADADGARHQLVDVSDPRLTEAEVLATYRGKWKHNLEDDAYRAFRAQTPHVYQWDGPTGRRAASGRGRPGRRRLRGCASTSHGTWPAPPPPSSGGRSRRRVGGARRRHRRSPRCAGGGGGG